MSLNSYDGSTRFFNYIVNSLNIKSYFSKLIKFNKDNTFIYKCGVSNKEYKTLYSKRPLVKDNEDILPPGSKKNRKLIPPKLTISQFKRLALNVNDVSVKLIAFPVILINTNSRCDKINNRKHLVVCILNKISKTIEVFDDKLPATITIFGEKFLLKDSLSNLMIPKVQTLLTTEEPLKIKIPRFNERYYKLFITNLTNYGYPADNYTAHAAFTANYLTERMKHPELSFDEIHTNVINKLQNNTKEFFECFDVLRNSTPKPVPCDLPEEILNPETLRCVKSDSNIGKNIQGLIKRRRQGNKINIHEHFLDSQLSENYLLTTEIGLNHALSMRYLQSKYGSIAIISKGMFKWNKTKLTTANDFKEIWENGMTNSDIRYIVFGITLTSPDIEEAHANSLIYDKTTRELERYEPNGGDYNEFGTVELDNAIITYFGNRIGTYIPPMLTCPIGFQMIDANEFNKGAKDIGGNCAVWALYYMELRLANPLFTRKQVINTALKRIRERGSFIMFINGYHRHVQLAMRQLRKKVKN